MRREVYICTKNENPYCDKIDENKIYIAKTNGDKIIVIDNNGEELITYDSKNNGQNISACVEFEKSLGNYYYYSAHFRRLDYLHYVNINTSEIKPESNLMNDFDNYLDDSYTHYGEFPSYRFSPSSILHSDPILHRCMFLEWLNGSDWQEIS